MDDVAVVQQRAADELTVDCQGGCGGDGFQCDLATGSCDDAVQGRNFVATQTQVASRSRTDQVPAARHRTPSEARAAAGHFQNQMNGSDRFKDITDGNLNGSRRALSGDHTVNLVSTKKRRAERLLTKLAAKSTGPF